MINSNLNTGYTITNTIFDTTIVENPYYESSSERNSLIEQMKNNVIVVSEPIVENSEEIPVIENK